MIEFTLNGQPVSLAGAGNGITNILSRARRGKPRTQTRDVLSGYRASSRSYQVMMVPQG
jgi:hypothetical protein